MRIASGVIFWLASLCLQATNSLAKPNIVVILTDDQDKLTLSQRHYLPKINKHLIDQGTLWENFFTPVSVCCPSRVSLLRAQFAHNHNVTFVSPPYGGWEVFNKLGYVGHTVPDFVQAAGYNTFYTGKLMNHHTVDNCERLPVSGFNSSDILVDPHTYSYWSPAFSRDNGPPVIYKDQYSTDLVRQRAVTYLEDGLKDDRPFFLTVAPVACHSWITHIDNDVPLDGFRSDIPASHPRHARLFPTEQLPRTPSFNPDVPLGVSWVKTLPKLNSTQVAYLDDFFRGRLRSLQAVDELVEDLVERLEKAGQLDNTYIFYTADNGYALGSHRRNPGKTLGFEEDIHVPFIARGPGIPKGYKDTLSSYGIVDLARTILDIAGAVPDYLDDGIRINLHQEDGSNPTHQLARHSISEYWVLGVEEGVYGGATRENNTYRTLRVHDEQDGQNYTYSYSVWCTGERELYDLVQDPHQVDNLLAPLNNLGRLPPFDSKHHDEFVLSDKHVKLLHRLDALLLVLKRCTGQQCHQPYRTLFPNAQVTGGEVFKLSQALEARFDGFFEELPKVQFTHCQLGFQEGVERPHWKEEWGYGYGGNKVGLGDAGLVIQT